MAIAVGNPAKINGKLRVMKKASKVSADEPADSLQGGNTPQGKESAPLDKQVQGGRYNPGAIPQQHSNVPSPQNTSSAVNAKDGLKNAIASRMYGKKLKVGR